MRGPRHGLLAGVGAATALAAAYAGAVWWSRWSEPPAASSVEIEQSLQLWLERAGLTARSQYVHTPAGRVHVLRAGAGSHSVLVIPGLGASAGEYAGLVRGLAQHRQVLAIDRPGSGLSDPITFSGHPRWAWNQVVEGVADAYQLERFDLVGHSLGGFVAGAYAIANPARVARLVLFAPFGIASRVPAIWNLSLVPGSLDLLSAATRLRLPGARHGIPPTRGTDLQSAQLLQSLSPELLRYQTAVAGRRGGGADLSLVARLMKPLRFRRASLLLPGLAAVAARTLVLWGDDDRQLPLQAAAGGLRQCPGLTLQVLPGAGHLFPFAAPQQAAALALRWLDSQAPD